MDRGLRLGLGIAILASWCHILGAEESASPGRRIRALLVGCTSYPELEKLSPRWRLRGPGNDVVLMRQLLIDRFAVPREEIGTLSEVEGGAHRPIRANIEREFRRLAKVAQPGDQVVILLAG